VSARRCLAALMLLAAGASAEDGRAPIVQSPQSVRPPALPPAPPPLLDERAQLSYAVGYDVGHNLLAAGPYADHAALQQGLEDFWRQQAPRYPESAMQQVLTEVSDRLHRLPPEPPTAGTDMPARFSYALGASIGSNLYPARERLDLATLKQAVAEGGSRCRRSETSVSTCCIALSG
jgi:hypothetical protein